MSGTTATVARLPSSFTKKKIDVTFTVATGGLGPGGASDTVTLSGHRCTVDVVNAGLRQGAQATLRIQGMTLAMMNRLSVACPQVAPLSLNVIQGAGSTMTISAGDDERGMSVIFSGQIFSAFIDFSQSPEVAFEATAMSSLQTNIQSVVATSYKGPIKVQSVLSDIAQRAGLNFVNRGVNLSYPGTWVCNGTAGDQIERICDAFNVLYLIAGNSATSAPTLTIWPASASTIDTQNVPRVTKNSGLIGYPAYSQAGVQFASLFNPNILWNEPVYLDSSYLPEGWVSAAQATAPQLAATGYWVPMMVTHALESEMPNGRWFTYVEAANAAFSNMTKSA